MQLYLLTSACMAIDIFYMSESAVEIENSEWIYIAIINYNYIFFTIIKENGYKTINGVLTILYISKCIGINFR